MFENAVNIQGTQQGKIAAGDSVMLAPGVYDVWGDADAYIAVSQSKSTAESVTSDTGYLVRSGNTIPVQILSASYLGASVAISYHKVK